MSGEQQSADELGEGHLPAGAPSGFFRLLNWLASALEKLGVAPVLLNTRRHRALLSAASDQAVALEGPDWQAEEETLSALWRAELQSIDACMNQGQQPLSARLAMFGGVKLSLERRSSVYRYLNAAPAVLKTELPRPLIIIGLPRTGTTLLQRLLACDSRLASFPFWELLEPVPARPDMRALKAKLGSASIDWVTPGQIERINAFHPTAPEYVDEETNVMWSAGIMNAAWWHYLSDEVFEELIAPEGKRAAYRFLKRCLEIMMSQRDGHSHMLLKSPFHGLYPETLLETFPNAVLVSLHREPCAVVESWISFMAMITAPSFKDGSISIKYFSERQLVFLRENAARLAAFLPGFEKKNPGRHLAISFSDLIQNPLDAVRDVYTHLGMDQPSQEDAQRMSALLAERAAKKSWSTKLSLDSMGLSRARVDADFQTYRECWRHLLER